MCKKNRESSHAIRRLLYGNAATAFPPSSIVLSHICVDDEISINPPSSPLCICQTLRRLDHYPQKYSSTIVVVSPFSLDAFERWRRETQEVSAAAVPFSRPTRGHSTGRFIVGYLYTAIPFITDAKKC